MPTFYETGSNEAAPQIARARQRGERDDGSLVLTGTRWALGKEVPSYSQFGIFSVESSVEGMVFLSLGSLPILIISWSLSPTGLSMPLSALSGDWRERVGIGDWSGDRN